MLDRHLFKEWSLDSPLYPNHMSFIIGPRQVGKTTLVQQYLGPLSKTHYFSWDDRRVRKTLRHDPYFFESLAKERTRVPIAFDEIHKMSRWKDYLKGVYDSYHDKFQIIVTGSGRLDLFQRGGDSLAGRYDPYFLYPLMPGDIERGTAIPSLDPQILFDSKPVGEEVIEQWLHLSGFPEPFLSSSEGKSLRWWKQYQLRLIQEDIRDLSKIESIDQLEHVIDLLPGRIGSPLSLNSLREEVQVAHKTLQNDVRILNQVFMIFEVPPFSRKLKRAVKKEKKIYFFYHPAADDLGARFENALALLLKKLCSSLQERAQGDFELCYLRDQDHREVDFLITFNGRPHILFEAKSSQLEPSSAALYYSRLLKIPLIQIVRSPQIKKKRDYGGVLSIHSLGGWS